MGSINSTILCEEEIEAIKNTTVFDYVEIEHLFERFLYLDKMNNGYLTYNELNNIPEFEINPFNKLIINVLEKRMDYENISFLCFLNFLEIFHVKTDKEVRIQFLFDIFDLHRDGRLCRSVLSRIGSLMGVNDTKEIEYALEAFDKSKKGFLDFNDFKEFYNSDPLIEKNMLIVFSKNIKQLRKIGLLDILIPSRAKKNGLSRTFYVLLKPTALKKHFKAPPIFFRDSKEKPKEQLEDLETLVVRLETSSYTEDKLDSLKLIHSHALIDPITTGTYSLNAVFGSLGELEDISYNLKIICEVLQTQHAMEFTDLVLKNETNIDLILLSHEKDPKEVYRILSIMSANRNFASKLVSRKNISFYLVNELENGRYEVLKNVIALKGDFKKQLIFEGIFEKLLGLVELEYKSWPFDLIEMLLRDDHFNQNYFIETKWPVVLNHLNTHNQKVFNLLNALVDRTNNNFVYIKENLLKYVDLNACLASEQYALVYSLIFDDKKLLEQFIEIYNETTVDSCTATLYNQLVPGETPNQTLHVCSYILSNKTIKFTRSDPFQYNSALLLLSEMLIYDDNHVKKLSDKLKTVDQCDSNVQNDCVDDNTVYYILIILTMREFEVEFNVTNQPFTINLALFILFNYDSTKVGELANRLVEVIYDDTSDDILVSLCILICLIHEIPLNFNGSLYLKHLKRLRKFFSEIDLHSKVYLVEECVYILLDRVAELIVKYSERKVKELKNTGEAEGNDQ